MIDRHVALLRTRNSAHASRGPSQTESADAGSKLAGPDGAQPSKIPGTISDYEGPQVQLGVNSSDFNERAAWIFRMNGYDLTADLSKLKLTSWPLDDAHPTVETGYQPAQVAWVNEDGSVGPPWAYVHDGLDIARSDPTSSPAVRAPVSGYAVFVLDHMPEFPDSPDETRGSVAIYDPVSHSIVQLLHVVPTDELRQKSPVELVKVTAGDQIGSLATDNRYPAELLERGRHTHVMGWDGRDRFLKPFDPLPYFTEYRDSVAPEAAGVYLASARGQKQRTLVDGRFDLVAEAFDRNDSNDVDTAPTMVGYKAVATTWQGEQRVLGSLNPTMLPFTDAQFVQALPALMDAVDPSQLFPATNQFRHDAFNHDRRYPIALTNIQRGADGVAVMPADRLGYLDITPDIKSLEVTVQLGDVQGNTRTQTFTLQR